MALKPARLQWSDTGSIESLDYGDVYFQREKGLEESRYVFLEGNNLPARFAALGATHFSVGETGFGSGLNFLLTAQLFAKLAPAEATLTFASIEKHPVLPADLERLYALLPDLEPFAAEILRQYPPLIEGFHTLYFLEGRIRLLLVFGEAALQLPRLAGEMDAWFLDGFAPVKNPDMWNDGIYAEIAAHTKPGGTLATFSSAGHVRRGLAAAGFAVRKIKGFGFKWSMTVAQKPGAAGPKAPRQTVAVLGGGIAGCAAAAALARRGHAVTLLDAAPALAAGASGNPAAIVYPKLTAGASPRGDIHAAAFLLTRNLLRFLRHDSWRPCGVLHKIFGAEEAQHAAQVLAQNDFPPDYAAGTAEGIFQPMAGMLSPPAFCAALAAASPRIRVLNNHRVTALSKEPAGWRVMCDGTPPVLAEIVIIALGNAALELQQAADLPLQSLRGQVTLLKQTAPSATLEHVVCHDGYITPAQNGLHCTGATFQKEAFGKTEARPEDDAENLAKLQQNLPALGFATGDIAGHRASFRAATPDRLPMAGACPDAARITAAYHAGTTRGPALPPPAYIGGLYIATGFGAHGMTGAPLAAELIAALINDEPLPVPKDLRQHLAPERFIFRALKRGRL